MKQYDTDLTARPDVQIWQERLQRATAAAQMFVWENDLLTGRQTWAGAAAQVIGCDPSDLPEQTAHAQFFVHPDDRGWLNDQFADALREGATSYAAEFRGVDNRMFRAEAAIDYDRSGQPIRVTGVTRDITGATAARDRAAASEALAHARTDELLTLYDAAPVGLCVLDRDLRLVRMNDAMKRMTQVAPGALPGQPLSDVMPCLAAQTGEHLRHVLAGQVLRGLEYDSLNPARPENGVMLRVNALPLQGETGDVQGVVVSVEDVTAERRADRALAEREALLAAIGASSPQLIYAKDTEGRILYANTATLDLLGLPLDQVVGRNSYDLMPNSGGKARLEADMKVMASGSSTRRDEAIETADGRKLVLHTTRAPLRSADGAVIGLVGLASDVTEQRQTEARRAFLLELADLLRKDGREAAVTTHGLARFFAVNRAGLAVLSPCEARQDGMHLDVVEERDQSGLALSLPPPCVLSDHDRWIGDDLSQGKTVCIADTEQDARLTGPVPFGPARAVLVVPIRRDGQLAACLYLAHDLPRDWTDADIDLVREAAERNWDAIERAQSEAALSRAEIRHRTVLEASAAVLWSTDREGNFVAPQPSWTTYTGQDWPDHAGYGWTAKIHPADLPNLLADWRKALDSGQHYRSQGRMWHGPTGSWRHIIVRGAPLRDADGRILEWIGAITDIDGQRRAEHNLRRSEARLRLAQEAAGLGIFELDPASSRIEWDVASRQILRAEGDAAPDLAGFLALVHPADRRRLAESIRAALAAGCDGRMALDVRLGIESATYPAVWIAIAAQAAAAEDGSERLVGSLRDITARKANELALQTLNAGLAQRMAEAVAERNRLWSVTDDLLVTADSQGKVLAASDSWAKVLGVLPRSMAEALATDVVHPDDQPQVRDVVNDLKTRRGSARLEVRLRAIDGSWRRFNWRLVHEPDAKRLYAVGRDVTAEREQATALALAQAQLHEAQKIETIGQLTGGVAHDFNNLLSAILSTLRSVQSRLTDAEQTRLVGGAIAAAERGATLTSRLLAFARRQELKSVVIDPAVMVAGIRDLLTRSMGPQITLREEVADTLPTIRTDSNQLELALLNLAVNARDAMPQGGTLTISARQAQATGAETDLPAGDFVVLSVTDTGTGMDESVRRRAAEPFFTTKGVGHGTGLGLSMVQGLAAQSGGAMRLFSTPGKGTTVEIWLPVSGAAATPLHAVADPAPPAAAGAARTLAILVVDDDPLVAMGTSAMLEDLGHRVIEVNSAQAALDAIAEGAVIDLVITDHAMPGMSGVQLAEVLQDRLPGVPIALASGYSELPNGLQTDLPRLAKPFGPADLTDLIRRLCP